MGREHDLLLDAGFVSIGLSFVSWVFSLRLERAGVDRADRWGIFVGEWAPTFIALGAAVRGGAAPGRACAVGREPGDRRATALEIVRQDGAIVVEVM